MINVRTGQILNNNFTLSVLSLNRTDIATDEDRNWNIDKWAMLFKARTYEEL